MSCACLERLLNLWRTLLPLVNLNVMVPLPIESLSQAAGSIQSSGGTTLGLYPEMRLILALPAIPLKLNLIEQILANAMAAAQINEALGVNVYTPAGATIAARLIASLKLNLPMLPIPQAALPNLPNLMNLTTALNSIAHIRTSLGIDLLIPRPNINLQLRAALTEKLGSSQSHASAFNASAMAHFQAYAKLVMAARLLGGIPNLIPALRFMANLQLALPGNLMMALMNLLAMFQAFGAINAVLGISPLSLNANLKIAAALKPLSLIDSASFPPSDPFATSGGFLPQINAQLAADAQMIAALRLGLLAQLQLPSLAPLSLYANFQDANLTSDQPCRPDCPVGGRMQRGLGGSSMSSLHV